MRRFALHRAAIAPAVLGAALITAAVPQGVAALYAAAAAPVVTAAQRQASLPPEQIRDAHDRLASAYAWWPVPAYMADAAELDIYLARQTVAAGGRPDSDLDRADRLLDRALAGAPADARAWLLLSYVRLRRDGPSAEAARALTLSMAAGPFEPTLLLLRAEMGLALFRDLDTEGRVLLASQIRMAWRRAPDGIVRLAAGPRGATVVRGALAGDLAALLEFERKRADRLRKRGPD